MPQQERNKEPQNQLTPKEDELAAQNIGKLARAMATGGEEAFNRLFDELFLPKDQKPDPEPPNNPSAQASETPTDDRRGKGSTGN